MKINLTPARIKNLHPKSKDQIIWDQTVPHFGIRIRPNGSMRYVHMIVAGGKMTKTTIGDAKLMELDAARKTATDLNVGIIPDKTEMPLFEDFALKVWWPQSTPHNKANTKKIKRRALDQHLLPTFGKMPLGAITKVHIENWFERCSRRAPGGANKIMGALKAILNHAVRADYLTHNPTKGIRLNPTKKITRFLSDKERHRLLTALNACSSRHENKADIIRMLLFTGCRRGEILNLRWDEVTGSTLALKDSKTGARTVWLSVEAKTVLTRQSERQANRPSPYVFPSPYRADRPMTTINALWHGLRKQIGLDDFRLHDLRHSFASQAIRQGIPLPVVSKLLGHSTPAMTMRYTHLATEEIEAAAERVGLLLAEQIKGERGQEEKCISTFQEREIS